MFQILPKHEIEKLDNKALVKYLSYLYMMKEKDLNGDNIQDVIEIVENEVNCRMTYGK
jgi:hypothetical protein